MRLIARAPIESLGPDLRPGDTFDAEPREAEAMVAAGVAEVYVEQQVDQARASGKKQRAG